MHVVSDDLLVNPDGSVAGELACVAQNVVQNLRKNIVRSVTFSQTVSQSAVLVDFSYLLLFKSGRRLSIRSEFKKVRPNLLALSVH